MPAPRIVIVGGGFAGFWAAAAAAAIRPARLERPGPVVTLVTSNPSLSVRPRLYEADLDPTVVELRPILEPIGVRLHIASVTHIDTSNRALLADDDASLPFDAAVVATGSSTRLPAIAGLAEHAHRIDVHHRAHAFRSALGTARLHRNTVRVSVVGGGLTGIELASELASEPGLDVTLIDGGSVGQPFGEDASVLIRAALVDLGVKIIDNHRVAAVTKTTAVLHIGGSVEHDLLVWCGGLTANPPSGLDPFQRDNLGRLLVDQHLRLDGSAPIWAAGDVARSVVDGEHVAPMSCQFAIPTGRLAGLNAAAYVLGLDPVPLSIDRYVTCIDLGSAGAVFTRGWERVTALSGVEGKRMKASINRIHIYPPTDADALLAAARILSTGPVA